MSKIISLSILFFLINIAASAQQVNPLPKVGKKGLKELIKTHFDYPYNELIKGTGGTVEITFNTDKEGEITYYHISRSISRSIDSSAIDLFRKIIWEPALNLGMPVTGSSTFEIKYNVKAFNKLAKRRGYKHIQPLAENIDTSFRIYQLKSIDTVPHPIIEEKYKNINEYIYSKLEYPEAAFKLGLSGNVRLLFVIETNGLPSNFIIEEHLGGGCSEEAIRILNQLRWYPGIKNGKAVRTHYRMNIKFNKPSIRDKHIPNQQGTGI